MSAIKVPLTRGLFAIVDDSDASLVVPYKWYAKPASNGRTWYAVREVDGRRVWMHHVICPPLASKTVDHIDGDGLDNRRDNLRSATKNEQCHNSRPSLGKRSAYKGVSWQNDRRNKDGGYWRARIMVNNRSIARHAASEREAALKYNELACEHFGEFAWLNSVEA